MVRSPLLVRVHPLIRRDLLRIFPAAFSFPIYSARCAPVQSKAAPCDEVTRLMAEKRRGRGRQGCRH